jgi:hypothetical protein
VATEPVAAVNQELSSLNHRMDLKFRKKYLTPEDGKLIAK